MESPLINESPEAKSGRASFRAASMAASAILAKRLLLVVFFIGLAGSATFGSDDKPISESERQKLIKAERASSKRLPSLLELCRAAKRVEIFEGLPHPRWEAELLSREQKRSDIFRNHDFDFYQPVLKIPDADRDRLLSEVKSQRTFREWAGPKSCGGFHPDLLVRFHLPNAVVDVHLCFGCSEAVFYGPKGHSRVDILETTGWEWEKIQTSNRTNRPPGPK